MLNLSKYSFLKEDLEYPEEQFTPGFFQRGSDNSPE